MKRAVAVEIDETDSSTETESLIKNTPRKLSDHKVETSPSVSVTSEKFVCQIKAVTDSLTQQLAHLCELIQELRNEKTHRRHEETASSRAASSSTGSTCRCDNSVQISRYRMVLFVILWYSQKYMVGSSENFQ